MCSACGVLGGGPDWIDRVGNPDGVGHHDDLTRGAERQRGGALVNLLLWPSRMMLVDHGNQLSVRGKPGGRNWSKVCPRLGGGRQAIGAAHRPA